MYERIYSSCFKKDLRLANKRGMDLSLIKTVIDMLADDIRLPPIYCDHGLKSKYTGYCECHIAPDWLLIYKIDKGILALVLTRTGTHSDLLGL